MTMQPINLAIWIFYLNWVVIVELVCAQWEFQSSVG